MVILFLSFIAIFLLWRFTNLPKYQGAVRIIADSINPAGTRLTTFEVTFQRWILAELNTHRMLSRNSASSRAIPIRKVIRQVYKNPAVPVSWGSNRPGMTAGAELKGLRLQVVSRLFLLARLPAIVIAWLLEKLGLHKQVSNRILEPWVWHTAVISATSWENFFKQRCDVHAQPEFKRLAELIRDWFTVGKPTEIPWGGWHLPYVDFFDTWVEADDAHPDPNVPPQVAMVSCARCARVSFARQNEKRLWDQDEALAVKLKSQGHWSPFEHVAQAVESQGRSGNFHGGWKQLRKFFPGEDGLS